MPLVNNIPAQQGSTSTRKWGELMQQADTVKFEKLEAGQYTFFVKSATKAQSTNGSDMIKIVYVVEGGPKQGRYLTINQFIPDGSNPNATSAFFRVMKGHGLDTAFFATEPSLDGVCAAMQGAKISASLTYTKGGGGNDYPRLNRVELVAAPAATTAAGLPTPTPVAVPQAAPAQPQAVQEAPVAPAPAPAPQAVATETPAAPAMPAMPAPPVVAAPPMPPLTPPMV